MDMKQHKCIKCQTEYNSMEEDAYYCEACIAEKKQIAKEIDKKMANKTKKKVKTTVQLLEENGKAPSGMQGVSYFSRKINY